MNAGKAVILGLVHGLTEFLPVSSSGHMILIREILGYDLQDDNLLVNGMLHLGLLLSLLLAFRRDILRLVSEGIHILRDILINITRLLQNSRGAERKYRRIISNSYRKFLLLLVVSWIPAALVGFALEGMSSVVRDIALVPALCLLVTSLFLFLADGAEECGKKPKETTFGNALFIGAAQGVAVLPGISGTASAITAGLLCGLERRFAVRYAFLFMVPYLLGCTIMDFSRGIGVCNTADIQIGIVVAFVSAIAGYLAVCLMLAMARMRKYKVFAIYCSIIGGISVVLYLLR